MILFLYPFASVSHPKARHGRSAIQQLSYPDGSSAILAVSYTDGHTDHIAVQLPRRQISHTAAQQTPACSGVKLVVFTWERPVEVRLPALTWH
ncbi:unnamed protein product [Macrosiphum euphorbiae]|uniref:Uncharacterized protein n=1 Tax=Macrosiphum euphorbiae TaxID=13131 RepID=A0AAV0Y865_9HEMI|nr:unnamed protein product [Macrosiphum euphorbiae]CAI6376345.1 unnamed protein product [Macrosiphum euphorbiae]